MPGETNCDRRRFLGSAGAAAVALGAAQLGLSGCTSAHNTAAGAARTSAVSLGNPSALSLGKTSFGPVKQIRAGVLDVGYVEAGPAHGHPVILMHGFPYDIHSYVEVAPLLAAKGYRVIVPYFRGYGSTTFLSPSTPRNVDQAAFALDTLALMDALKVKDAILAGYDWGSRTGDIISALWPHRVKGLVSVSRYLITNLAAQQQPLPPKAENAWWYQYYFDKERGRAGTRANPDTPVSKASFRRLLLSPYPRSPSMANTIRSRCPGTVPPIAATSPASTSTGTSTSAITCRKRHPKRSRRPSPTWAISNCT